MKLDDVQVKAGSARRRKSQAERQSYERKHGWDIVAVPLGVMVTRLPECTMPRDEWEPEVVLIPWALVSCPCAVAEAQITLAPPPFDVPDLGGEPVRRGPGRPPKVA